VLDVGARPGRWWAGQALLTDSLLGSDAAEQARELATVGRAQRRADAGCVMARRRFGSPKSLAPGGSQVEGVGPAIDGIAASLDETVLLEVVDKKHHARRVEAEERSECLLGLPFVRRQPSQHPVVPGLEPGRGDGFREPSSGMRAQLHQQEGESLVVVVAHKTFTKLINNHLAQLL
jgi:hypothetical protein